MCLLLSLPDSRVNVRAEALAFGLGLTPEQDQLLLRLEQVQPLPGMPPESWGDRYQKALGADRRRSGSFFTPQGIAEKVVRETLEPLMQHRDPSRLPLVLDPACGAGWFLFASYRYLSDWLISWFGVNKPGVLEEGRLPTVWRERLLRRLHGLDRDPIALALARLGLRRIAEVSKANADLRCVDSLNTDWPQADAILGNPPYVRLRLQDPETRGNSDLYLRFVEKSLDSLEPGGRAGLVVPNRLFTAQYARNLRNKIAEGRHLAAVEDLEGGQHFPGASTYICLLWLSKDPSLLIRVRRGTEQSWVETRALYEDPWALRAGATAPLESRLARLPTLGSVAHIFVGVQTSADRIFHLPKLAPIEDGLQVPLLSGRDVPPWVTPTPTQAILFPYRQQNGQMILLPWEQLAEEFPAAARYLSFHRDALRLREGGKFDDERWYRYGRSQNLGIQHAPKLCVPRLVRRLGACLDEGSILDNVDVLGVRPRVAPWTLDALLGLLNSRLWSWYLSRISIPFRGGYRSANRQFLERLPIPDAIPDTWIAELGLLSRELRLLCQERGTDDTSVVVRKAQLDAWVEEAFGLGKEERGMVG